MGKKYLFLKYVKKLTIFYNISKIYILSSRIKIQDQYTYLITLICIFIYI